MTATMETYALHPPLVDEGAARRTLREQITRLEDELSGLVLSAWPATIPVGTAGASGRGAALLSLAQLEQARDALAARAAAARKVLDERGRLQEEARRAREEMLLDPAAYPFARVTNEAVGEPGCRDWHVRPRFGLLGMIMRWWRVVVSSGCPLAGRPGPLPLEPLLLDPVRRMDAHLPQRAAPPQPLVVLSSDLRYTC